MDNENNNGFVGWVITFIVILLLGGTIYYFMRGDEEPQAPVMNAGSEYFVSTVQVKHQYANGTHTYVGALDLPSPCYAIQATVRTAGELNRIDLSTTKNEEEFCAQMISTKTFKVSIDGPAERMVEGYLNGKKVELNIFEVPAGENIDDAEFDTKG